MLLTISTSHQPATDLGYLLVKHPDRLHTFDLPFGKASVFYPEATESRCTAGLMLDIDPIGLVRGRGDSRSGPLSQYVNDRPYAASSFLTVAMKRVFSTAMAGTCKGRPDLADTALPFEVEIPALRSRPGDERIRACFEPLGYTVEATAIPLDESFPQWGDSPYYSIRLVGQQRLQDLLAHLYVLLPALDGDKHYFVGDDEVGKLLDKAKGWLSDHPERDWITGRYLKRKRSLIREALAQLMGEDEEQLENSEVAKEAAEERIERPLSLNEQRMGSVLSVLRQSGARRVVDLGCGEGRLLSLLMQEKQFDRILGVDVSMRSLDIASSRLKLDRLPPMQRERIDLAQGALTYRDQRLEGFDAACLVEVIEHMDAPRLPALERALFGYARPKHVVVTTPNVEYNALFETLDAGRFRHPDHRFEWTREEFESWAAGVGERRGYAARFLPVGPVDDKYGAPTQMAIFERVDA